MKNQQSIQDKQNQRIIDFAMRNFSQETHEYGRPDMKGKLAHTKSHNRIDPSRTNQDLDGDGRRGVDCSSLVFYSLKGAGFNLPQNTPFSTHTLFNGMQVTNFTKKHFDVLPPSSKQDGSLKPGDLLMMRMGRSQHIAIFKGYDAQGRIHFFGSQTSTGPAEVIMTGHKRYWDNPQQVQYLGALRAKENFIRPEFKITTTLQTPNHPPPSSNQYKQTAQTQNELLLLQTALQSGISSRTELANLMAQCAHESMGFKRMDESFKYSKGIDYIKNICESTKRFPDNQLEAARQEALSGNPQKLAEMMYGSRPDLGNIHPGDGFKFHGRGFVQLTGRANYEAAGKALGLDLTNNPDLAAKPEHAAKIAVWYWQHNIVSKGIQENVRETGIAFNGGTNGSDSRQKSFENLFQKLNPEYVAKMAANTPQHTEPERQTKQQNPAAPALAEPAALTALNAINNKLDTLLKAHEAGNRDAFRQQVCEMAQHRDAVQMMARASAEAQHERVEQQQNSRQQETLQQENAQQQGKAMRR